ncbi:GIY-YIG nuclease family protein [Candidatus Parcubacteria bacterium]|nr:GIY-YIG nuclease family protein [Candidatus Parcubacteria bacterium]
MSKSIAAQIRRLPTASGVYLFRNQRGRILYIGKAINLRNRVRSHFQSKPSAYPTKIGLYENVTHIDWYENESEIEALILEANLIKKYEPRFNVDLKDNTNYLFVGFTKEEFPHVFFTHQFALKKVLHLGPKGSASGRGRTSRAQADLIGPFTSATATRETLAALRHIFPYCTCTETHERPCVRTQLGKCLGLCCLKAQARLKLPATERAELTSAYRRNIRSLKAILTGRKKDLLKTLKQGIIAAAKRQDFEAAAKLRDQYRGLEELFAHERVLSRFALELPKASHASRMHELRELGQTLRLAAPPRRIEAYDVANIQGELATGSMVTFENGLPNKNFYRKFKIKISGRPNDVAMIREVLQRRIAHTEWPYPDLIVVDGGKTQRNTALSVLRVYKLDIPAIGHAKGLSEIHTETGLIPLAELPDGARNLLLRLRDEAHRFARKYFHWRQKKMISVKP